MGDLANMTDCDGRVNGFRLLRWLRSRAEMQLARIGEYLARGDHIRAAQHRGMLAVFLCMADDIERELTPPDYTEDDGDTAGPDDKDTGPCEGCGRLADRVPVRDNGKVWFACPACAARVSDDVVDLDDSALAGGPEAE